MGTKIKGLVSESTRTVTIENLIGKTIAIDAFNVIYQFITTIKGSDRKPLRNRDGEITSHLTGLLYRNTHLLQNKIKPIYCFDGIRKSHKIRWETKRENAIRINEKIIESSHKLLNYMGIQCIDSPGEGEAQCCYLVKQGDAWAVASQDYDCLTFGGDRIIRNLASGTSKKQIEFILLGKVLSNNDLTIEQLIDMSILVGNDFYGGIKGIGEKKALNLIKKHSKIENIPNVIIENLDELRLMFSDPLINNSYEIKKIKPNYEKLHDYLVFNNGFSSERINSIILKLKNINSSIKRQKSLFDY